MMTTAHVGLVFLLSLCVAGLHTIPAPANFTIVSHNFRHTLQWVPGADYPPWTVFSVRKWCNDGNSEVWQITGTKVDVSEHLKNIYDSCMFALWASLDNTTSPEVTERITPYEDTIIGPPVTFVSGCGDCLIINISLPIETNMTKQLRQFYNSVKFNLSWKNAGQSKVEHISISSKRHVLRNLQPGKQYCVRVLPKFNSNHNTQPSAWHCEYTSTEEPRGALYLMGWSLGASVSGLAVLALAVSLIYTGCLWKLKTLPLKSLSNIVHRSNHYLIPEKIVCESVSSIEPQLKKNASKNDPTKNNKPPNVQEDSENEQHEENYFNKADTEDEEDYDEEDEGHYMGCVIDDSGLKKALVSTLPLHNSSGSCHAEEIQLESKNKFIPKVFEDRNLHLEVKNTHVESKGKEDVSGNINLFSVTLKALGSQDEEDEPLLPKPALELSTSDVSLLEEPAEEEELLLEAIKTDVEEDTTSGYLVTHTGNMYEGNRSSLEESDCDTDYIAR